MTRRRLWRPRPDSPVVTALLAGLVAVAPLSVDMPLPALPRIAEALGAGIGPTQLVISAFLAGFAAAQLVYGPLSDRFGRRPVMLAGLGLYLVAGIACSLAPSIELMVIGRLFQGIGACAAPVAARAIVRDVHEGTRAARILSFIATGMAIAPILAPIIGAYVLLWFDWNGIFAVLAGSALVLLVLAASLLDETNAHIGANRLRLGSVLATYGTMLSTRAFLAYVLPIGCMAAGLFSFISGSPFVLIELEGIGPDGYAAAFAVVMVGQVSGALMSARLVPRLGIDRLVALGLGTAAAGGLAMASLALAGIAGVAAFVAPMTLFMLGNGFLQPSATAGSLQPFPRSAGAASALIGFIQMASGAAAGVVVGQIYDGSARIVAMMICAFALAAGIGHLVLRRRTAPA